MAEEHVEHLVASLKKLASLPEAEIHELFESLTSEERGAYAELFERDLDRVTRSLGFEPKEPSQK